MGEAVAPWVERAPVAEPSPYPDYPVDHAGFRVTLSPIPPSVQMHLSLPSFNDYVVGMTVVKSYVLRF